MQKIKLPYGNTTIQFTLPVEMDVDLVQPNQHPFQLAMKIEELCFHKVI